MHVGRLARNRSRETQMESWRQKEEEEKQRPSKKLDFNDSGSAGETVVQQAGDTANNSNDSSSGQLYKRMMTAVPCIATCHSRLLHLF